MLTQRTTSTTHSTTDLDRPSATYRILLFNTRAQKDFHSFRKVLARERRHVPRLLLLDRTRHLFIRQCTTIHRLRPAAFRLFCYCVRRSNVRTTSDDRTQSGVRIGADDQQQQTTLGKLLLLISAKCCLYSHISFR